MDVLDTWFDHFVSTPLGGILVFLLVFLMRLSIDEARRRRRRSDSDHSRRRPS